MLISEKANTIVYVKVLQKRITFYCCKNYSNKLPKHYPEQALEYFGIVSFYG